MPDFLKGLLGIGTMFLKSACDEYGFNVGPFNKCIEKTNFELTTIKNTTTADQKCKLLGDEYSKLSDFVETECGNEAVDNMWKY
ncbi:Protein CBG04153 [Caenorhabditis briggsae]|uniref:Protein CBG04153 n=1 Tax=Caenorhabditis briggsae TaxID=6238 RepID=A8WWA4_CAEBR|nr:Protein CBG04153 [Caenorhabditis briggsae]CAP24913.1 Protein CBG04153 [Caenorhabditis briggsae]